MLVHLGGCQANESENHPNVEVVENNIAGNDFLHGFSASRPVVCDSYITNDVQMITAPLMSSLCSTTGTEVNSSVAEELHAYRCDLCNKWFATAATLRHHRRHHRDCATCNDCGQSFHSSTILHRHSVIQCPRKTVICNICRMSFDGWPSLYRHTARTHSEMCRCPVCGQAFLHVSQLVNHRTVHAVCRCRICSQGFSSRRGVNRHIRKHVTGNSDERFTENCLTEDSGDTCVVENQLNCVNDDVSASHCQSNWVDGGKCVPENQLKEFNGDACLYMSYLNKAVTDNHVSCQQKEIPAEDGVSDPYLKDGYSTQLASTSDSPAHTTLQVQLCRRCTLPTAVNGCIGGRRIVSCFEKANGVSILHSSEERVSVKPASKPRVTCARCSRTFERLSDLHVHMRCHTGEMKYKCSLCDRSFRKSGTLTRHMLVHTGERPYVCEMCGKSYRLLFHLRLHTTIHSSDRPFTCSVCRKDFRSGPALKRHQFVHSGIKPFCCSICLRSFNRSSNMRAHMRVHDSARQKVALGDGHVCILCRKKFSNATSLQAHLQTHTRHLEQDASDTVSSVTDGVELASCRLDKQLSSYVALPLVHFDDFDVS